ncbi:hypothetical protein [Rouxiella sp. Mn2063]|uniref:hypothetical protein n=1 Tax=Rouxiella sp. Mn2063 TaxID=3395262 RepID=UPI003BDF327E
MSFSILLERALPLSKEILDRIESGELNIFGGTIRDTAGKIVKHLVFPPEGQNNQLNSAVQEINNTINQSHAEVMNQLANQTAMLSMVNIMSARQTTETLSRKLEELGDKIDALDQKISLLLDEAKFSKLIKFSEIKSKALGAIEEALYANQKQNDPQFIRLHIIPLRRALGNLDTLLRSLLSELENKEFIDNFHFVMLIADLKNKAAFVLSQTHIRLEEDNIANGYLERNTESNVLLRKRLEALKKTGAFSPHIITRDVLEVLKTDISSFKQLETQSVLLTNQNILALELKIPQKVLLSNSFDTIKMLDPVQI